MIQCQTYWLADSFDNLVAVTLADWLADFSADWLAVMLTDLLHVLMAS